MKQLAFLAALAFAALTAFAQSGADKLTINEKEYFHSKNLSVLVFHNIYPVGMQGGIEIIQHDYRTATNGTVTYTMRDDVELIPGVDIGVEAAPTINNPERQIDGDEITLPFDYSENGLQYNITVSALDNYAFEVRLDFLEPVDTRFVDEVHFSMEFYPEVYAGKSYISESSSGVFPFVYKGDTGREPVGLMASGREFVFAPEDEMLKVKVSSEVNEMTISDTRVDSRRFWFTLRTQADLTKTDGAVVLRIAPNVVEEWTKPPMIGYSQIGYHPDQQKVAVIELDRTMTELENGAIHKLSPAGDFEQALEKQAVMWDGEFLRYNYAHLDFSEISEPGLYKITYGGEETGTFEIRDDIYAKGPWELTLDIFYPVQMCHMNVRDRARLWHGLCHMDDALQVPTDQPFYDGYSQGETTDTDFEPHTTIPALNTGGWHDAGDDDVHFLSTGTAAYMLGLAYEEFGIDRDQTTIDFEKREVHTYQPDGIPDAVQQVIHGAQWLVAHYEHSDHAFAGVISSKWETYLQLADWGLFTDNKLYVEGWPEDSLTATHSGKLDDRYVFTNRDTRRDYCAARFLAGVARVIGDHDAQLAEKCLTTAKEIWERESQREPAFYQNVGTPRNLVEEQTKAATELYISTGDKAYLDWITGNSEEVLDNIFGSAWAVARVIDDVDDEQFASAYYEKLQFGAEMVDSIYAANPFGVRYDYQVWGIGWTILFEAVNYYYLVKRYPELFDEQPIFNTVEFILGRHPGSNISFVSGVGTHRPIPSFAYNRTDYGYTQGGVFSGVSLILPDFPELKEDHPWLWQQSEIMIWGATPYVFSILAADKLAND